MADPGKPQSVIRLAGAFPMVEMVLSGILSASVRILLLATPRRGRYAFG